MDQKALSENQFRRRVISRIALAAGGVAFLALVLRHFLTPLTSYAWLNFGVLALLFSIPLLIRRGISIELSSSLLIIGCTSIGVLSGLSNGGMRAPATALFIITPVIGFFASGVFGARLAMVSSALSIGFLLWVDQLGWLELHTPAHLYSYNIALIYGLGAVITYVIGSSFESSRRAREQEIMQLNQESHHQSRLAALGQMSAGVAHEINNPLAIISGSLALLEGDREAPEKFARRLEILTASVHRIEKIVKGLKRFSRVSENAPFSRNSIETMVNQSLAIVGPKMKYHSVALDLDIKPDLFIDCEPVEIEQVFINLIDNAVDAVKLLPEKWIQIRAIETPNGLQLYVENSGPRMPEVVANRLFQPFFTTKPTGEGTGLGLSISKRILDRHKATIGLRSEGLTTCFVLQFPAATNAPARVAS